MSYFAQLDENNLVIRVIVVDDKDTSDFNGIEDESIGISFCKKLFGSSTNWKQTFLASNTRLNFASTGYIYDEELDAFIPPKPYDSWILNTQNVRWESPIGSPPELTQDQIKNNSFYIWDEEVHQKDQTSGWILYVR